MEPPPRAQIGLYSGIFSVLFSVGICVAAFISTSHDQARADARTAEIDKQVGSKASDATLDHATACLLAEEAALKTGFDDNPGYSLEKFDCPGKLVPSAEAADLEDFAFAHTDTTYKIHVCFKHGAKWFVENLSEDACNLGATAADGSAASTTPSPSTTPTSSASSKHRTKHVAPPSSGH